MMRLYRIDEIELLRSYKNTWNHILEVNENTNPFIEFDWIENWWRYLGKTLNVEILIVEKDEEIIAFCPFIFNRKWNTTIIEFLGHGEANYMDFIVYDKEREVSIQFVFEEMMKLESKCVFNLHGLLSSSPSMNIISSVLVKIGIEPSIFPVITPYINLEKISLSAYLKKRRKIHGLDRREKRLSNLGEVKVRIIDPREIEYVFTLHDKHWSRKQDTSQFTSSDHKKFYTSLLNIHDVPLQAIVEGLYLDDQMIAFSYGFLCRGRFLGYIIGHDDDFGLYGPGTILDKELIANSDSKSITIFDLSIGYEPYKFEWNTDVDYTNNIVFSTNDWQTKFTFNVLKYKNRFKEILKMNYKIVLFKREFIGQIVYFIKTARLIDWAESLNRICSRLYSNRTIDIYKQSVDLNEDWDYYQQNFSQVRQIQSNLPQINKRFYNGFLPYSDTSNSLFWVQSKIMRVDEVGYLKPLAKQSVFILEWEIHKLSKISSYLRQNNEIKDIFIHLDARDKHLIQPLKQLGFIHVNSISKTCFLFKSSTNVINLVNL